MRNSSNEFVNWRWLLIIWTIIASISATMLYLNLNANGRDLSFGGIFMIKLIVWFFWGALTPLIIYLGRRFSLEPGRRTRAILVHIPLSIFFASLNVLFYSGIIHVLNNTGIPLLSTFLGVFFSQFEWHFIIYWTIVIIGYAFEYYARYRERELESIILESELTKAKLQALKMQLHPHFLFNTLNNISSLVRQGKQNMAVSMLSGVSDMLRVALAEKDQHETQLRNEINFIKRYLEVEKVRFNDKLEVDYVYAEDLLEVYVPSFILQPIVENAVNHGLSKRLAATLIRIEITSQNENLYISVYNDGPSLNEDFDMLHDSGIGLRATADRLRHMYGKDYTLRLQNQGAGVSVQIIIPLHYKNYNTG